MQDRAVKILLSIIAVLLLCNLLKHSGAEQSVIQLPELINSAQAQSNSSNNTTAATTANTTSKLRVVEGKEVQDIQNIISVGDGRSFVVSNPNGFVVYQLYTTRQ